MPIKLSKQEQWFKELKAHLRKMPKDVELLVSAYGVITMMPAGSISSYAGHRLGMDLIAGECGISEFEAARVMGENSTI